MKLHHTTDAVFNLDEQPWWVVARALPKLGIKRIAIGAVGVGVGLKLIGTHHEEALGHSVAVEIPPFSPDASVMEIVALALSLLRNGGGPAERFSVYATGRAGAHCRIPRVGKATLKARIGCRRRLMKAHPSTEPDSSPTE